MYVFTKKSRFNADQYTPVGLYSRLRDKHRMPCLLESNDYHDRSDSKSVIGLDPLVEITIQNGQLAINSLYNKLNLNASESNSVYEQLKHLIHQFEFEDTQVVNGFFWAFRF